MTYHVSTLPSGLRVATETLSGMESVTVAVTVDVGSRHEADTQGGISHLLEHMAFKGTKRRSARDIAEEMDMVGGNMNAYTSLENTVYYTRVLKQDMHLAVDILADIIQHSTFDSEELTREQEVILQEIAMHHDTPDDLIFDYFNDVAYPNQPIGRSILGKPEQVKSYTPDDLKGYMHHHYNTNTMVVTAAGNVEHETFRALAEAQFQSLPTAVRPAPKAAHYKGGDNRVKRTLEQLHLMLGFQGASIHDDDYYIWQVLVTLLGGGMSSRLFQEVREKRGLAYTVQSFLSSYSDSGVLALYAATSDDRAEEMLKVTAEVLTLASPISDNELQRAKNQIKASLFMSRESSASIAEWMGRHLLCYGRYRPASEIAALVDKVTTQDLVKAAKTLLASPLSFAALGPQKTLPDYPAVQAMIQR